MKKFALCLVLCVSALIACQSPPPSDPVIDSFTATPPTLPFGGGGVKLEWVTKNATVLSLDQGIGIVTGTSRNVNLTTTTTFTLTAANPAGTLTTKSVKVDVATLASVPMVALTSTNQLVRFNSSTPNQAISTQGITGLTSGEELVAIDVRPMNGLLYGLGKNASGGIQLYLLNPNNGIATLIGTAGGFVDAAGNPVSITGTDFDLEFNPIADRIRVITNTGQNFRMNPNTGAVVDGDLNGAPGSVAGVNMDGPINGATINAAAYTNNTADTSVTTLYTLDVGTAKLFLQNPPNSGTQTAGLTITAGGNVGGTASLDIAPGVNASASNTAVNAGTAFGHLVVGGTPGLYAMDLVSGTATLLGGFGSLPSVRDVAVSSSTPNGMALSNDGLQLQRFALDTPGTATNVTFSGVTAGESLVGLSLRPATGQVYTLGVNATANTGTLYVVDPKTGACTVVGIAGQVAFVDGSGVTAVDLPDASVGYGMDFNPTVDRVRVVAGSGLNFRVNPFTGAPIDGNPGSGTNTDGPINGGTTSVHGTSYTNSFAQSLTGGVTTLYTLDASTDSLFIQNPPNAGTQTASIPVTLNGSPLNFAAGLGFDIPSSISVSTSNTAATGEAFAVLTVGATTGLYRINLSTGVATLVGNMGGPVRALLVTL